MTCHSVRLKTVTQDTSLIKLITRISLKQIWDVAYQVDLSSLNKDNPKKGKPVNDINYVMAGKDTTPIDMTQTGKIWEIYTDGSRDPKKYRAFLNPLFHGVAL